jgi:uncharacterized protein
MSGGLPAFIEPLRLAERRQSLAGYVALARCRRLAESLADTEGEVEVDLEFDREGPRRVVVRGSVRAELRLVCQRCLEPMTLRVEAPVRLVVVRSEAEADRLEEGEDPLLVGQDPISLVEMVEDEILLALPQVPTHPPAVCGGPALAPGADGDGPRAGGGPFATLASLRGGPGGKGGT